jgi:hypothetical protein
MTYTPLSTDTGATFLGLATLNAGSNDVEIYADIKDTATAKTFKMADLKLTDFTTAEYVSNQNSVTTSVGTISGIAVSIDKTSLSVNKTDGLGNTTLASGSKGVILNTVDLKVTQGNEVSFSNPKYTITFSGSASNNAFLTLYADGTAIQTKTFSGSSNITGTVSFETLSTKVGTTPVKLTLKADFSDAYNTGDFKATLLSADVTDELTSANVTLPTVAGSANFTIATAEGQLAVSDNNPKATLLLAGDTAQRLLAFRVRANNDDIKLRDLTFTGTSLDSLNNFKVTDKDGVVIIDSATTTTSTGVSFTNLTVNDVIAQDTTKTYYLVADVNLNTATGSLKVSLDQTNTGATMIKSSNGTDIQAIASSSAITSNDHRVEENMAVIAKESNGSKDLATSAVRFSITATGKSQATLSGFTVKANLSGYTGATDVSIYKDSFSTNNLVGSGTISSTGAFIAVTAYPTVDAGSTNHYIVVVNGAVIDSTAQSVDWTMSVTNVTYNLGTTDVTAATYDNMGTFPITEVK